jgi:hypothetical protein
VKKVEVIKFPTIYMVVIVEKTKKMVENKNCVCARVRV